jgi:cell wall-associated NlpC family hydrolase
VATPTGRDYGQMPVRRFLPLLAALVPVLLAVANAAAAGDGSWAAAEIRAVTGAGVLGTSPAGFHPQAPLSQRALAAAIAATDAVQHPPAPPPAPPQVLSTIAPNATIAGVVPWQVTSPTDAIGRVDFTVDGVGVAAATASPFAFDAASGGLDTTKLADGAHSLAVNVAFADGGSAVAVWTVTVANADASAVAPGAAAALPLASWSAPPAATAAAPATRAPGALYRALAPTRPVTIKQLDAALVSYLGLGGAARAIERTLAAAGLQPPPNTGTEAVARMLGLRLNHPASEDSLELLPNQPATRAEAAWSFARVLRLQPADLAGVARAAAGFMLPPLTPWQRRILTTAVSYVGYPYVWGGTSPTHEVEFGVPSAGGFDCSGFVWRVYKLTPYADEGDLAGVLRGRTTYQMSGEVPRRERIAAAALQPGDVMFFGANGPRSRPSVVDHAAIYLGNGWFVQSSDEGVTLLPFDGWYRQSFAWARRPLREAGLG